ncbi:MAG TPA: FG-GAP-like repeat-containing protein [Anaerolineae bacterium]|nr:FG-GAP-like repeat-containing protein [Anaerolineae bacterium]
MNETYHRIAGLITLSVAALIMISSAIGVSLANSTSIPTIDEQHTNISFSLTSNQPAHQALNAATNTPITMIFNANIDPSSITTATINIHGHLGTYDSTYTLSGNTLTITPTTSFFPGEVIRVTATDALQSTGGTPLTATQFQFTTETPALEACQATFNETGAGLPGIESGTAAWADYDNDGHLDILLTGLSDSGEITHIYHNNGDDTFTNINAALPGVTASTADWGDYDNDGDLDIILTGSTISGEITHIYRNNGDNTFTNINATLPGVTASTADWGDYDNDGDLDILLAGSTISGEITHIYRNNGDDTFTNINATLPGVTAGTAAWGDYDNDGDLDIILTGLTISGEITHIYRNNANDTFTNINAGLPGVSDSSVAWGDYNNDGHLDILLTGSEGGRISIIYRNNGDDTFTDINANLAAMQSGSVTWGDYDNDGDLDILLAGQTNSNRASHIYRNNGDDTFTDINANLAETKLSTVAWGDYDNDGDLDFLLAGETNSGPLTHIYRNDPYCQAIDDSYSLLENNTLSINSLNGVLSNDTSGSYEAIVAIDVNNGDLALAADGSFTYTPTVDFYGTDNFVYRLAGRPDMITATVTIIVEETFNLISKQPSHQALNVDISSPITMVFDAPIAVDTITSANVGLHGNMGAYNWTHNLSGNTLTITPTTSFFPGEIVQVIVSNGIQSTTGVPLPATQFQFTTETPAPEACQTTFTDIGAGLPGVYENSVAWGDYNNDGDLDFLTGDSINGSSRVYHNNGNGTFTNIGAELPSIFHSSVAWGDYDNDDDLDFILTGISSGYISQIYRNDGNDTFTNINAGLPGVAYSSVAWGDYDNDGDLDFLLTGLGYSGYISQIYRNDGNDTFTNINAGLPGVGFSSVAWGDYDNDGDLDILLTGDTDADITTGPISRIYRNDGNDTFVDIGAGLPGVSVSSVAWGDYDNDGDLDLLLTGSPNGGGTSIVYRNDGNDTFTDIGAGLPGVTYSSVAWGDYDNDGDLDFLLTGLGYSGRISQIYRNNGDDTFTNINAGLPGIDNSSVAWGDYDNDGDLDFLLTGDTNADSTTGHISQIYRNDHNCEAVNDSYTTTINTPLIISNTTGVLNNDIAGPYEAVLATDVTYGELTLQANGNFVYTPTLNFYGTDSFTYHLGTWPNLVATVTIAVNASFTMVSSQPMHQASNTNISSPITLVFDEPIDVSTVTTETVGIYGHVGAYDWVHNITGDTLTITPTTSFFPGEVIRVSASNGLQNIYGVPLTASQIQFTTQTTAPQACASSFTNTGLSLPGVSDSSVSWADYDNDGDLDILLTGLSSSGPISHIYQNNGNGTFTSIGAGLPGVELSSNVWGDYDNDGDLDFLLTGLSSSGSISHIYQNNGNGTFTSIGAGLLGVDSSSNAWGDYDNDGDLDLLLTGSPNVGRTSIVYRNNGNNTFTDINAGLVEVASSSVAWGDYDNDGDLDILLTGNRHNIIYRNNGDDTFTDINAPLPKLDRSSVAWGDYDNDGDLDILLTGSDTDPISAIYRNNGDETFTDILAGLVAVDTSSVAWGDYDNDGDLDILLTGESISGPISHIYRNNGDATFTDILAGLPGVRNSSAAWGDYDNDGDLDILLTGESNSGPISHIYRNDHNCLTIADTYSTTEDTPLIISNTNGVLSNDVSGSYEAIVATDVNSGELQLDPDGGFVYTPTLNFYGTDTFVYRLAAWPSMITSTVTITVTSINDGPPIAANDYYTMAQNTTLTVLADGILANDTDPDGNAILTLNNPPSYGTVTLAADGAFVYTPTTNFLGVDQFSYRLQDGDNEADVGSVAINVVAEINQAPIAVADWYTTTEDFTLAVEGSTTNFHTLIPPKLYPTFANTNTITTTITLLDNDSDSNGDTLITSVVTDPLNGVLYLNIDGEFIYIPDEGSWGTDSFIYMVSDGVLTATAPVTITVIPVAETPVVVLTPGTGTSTDLDFVWTTDSSNCAYTVYGNTFPYFDPYIDGNLLATLTAGVSTHTEAGVVGDINTNHYFVVEATGCADDRARSPKMGAFDFALVAGN